MKEVLAYRQIKKDNTKIAIRLLWVFFAVLFIFCIVCFINPMQEDFATPMGYVFLVLCIIYVLIIWLVSKAGEKIRRLNTYPKEAIVYDHDFIFIYDDAIRQIKVSDITKVKGVKDTVSGPYINFEFKTGYIVIITNTEKYKIEQLENVDDSVALIKKYINK